MNEYILPVDYQNLGCGISVIVAGLEQNNNNYKYIGLSIDGVNFIETVVSTTNLDFSEIVSFDDLTDNKYYNVYCNIIYLNDSSNSFTVKMPASVGVATVIPSIEIARTKFTGGVLSHDVVLPKEVEI